ncbi:MAG: ABC transporter substrate-binding protein [Halodesulfurarchaeum sp.]
MSLDLSIALWHRDITKPLLTGEVEPDGINATVLSEYPPKRFRRFFERGEYDVAEVSMGSYVASRSRPEEYPYTAIPVFPAKKFPHSFFYKRKDAGIEDPSDLEGKKVGIQAWLTTRDVWVRGIASERYGLDLESVKWYRRRKEDFPTAVPDRYDIQPVPGEQSGDALMEPKDMRELFFEGELDAVMDPAGAMFWPVVESDEAELMFDDPLETEKQYYRDTGIHPVLHAVAIRDEILQEHPWVAVNLYEAFCEARDLCLERNRTGAKLTTLTWNHFAQREQDEILGRDAWEYGLTDRTVPEVEKYVEYAVDQGMAPYEYDVDELFHEVSIERT